MFRISINTNVHERSLCPYVCKGTLSEMFEESDIPDECDIVLKARKQGQSPPYKCAAKVRIRPKFESEGVDYQTETRWVRKILLVHDADRAVNAAGIEPGDYWLWLERD